MMGHPTSKVFGIGFHKTGTSSLAEALRILGYRVTGPNFVSAPDLADTALDRAVTLLPRFDAFQDNPWPLLFRDLDRVVPGSRFVFTTRDPELWIASVVAHFGTHDTPMRRWIYGQQHGAPVGSEDRYLERFGEHYREVHEYFAGRENLLTLDLTAGDGWETLCPFLGLRVPPRPFPEVNTKNQRVVQLGSSTRAVRLARHTIARVRRLRRPSS